jgi:2-dehydropantoate 2-reductase
MSMRFLIFGAGAIGTYIGGSLALAGNQVVFVEKPEVAAELRQRGLSLNVGGLLHTVDEPLVEGTLDHALTRGPFDLAVLAVKSYDTMSALAGWQPYLKELPTVLCLQNGVENEAVIAAQLGEDRVLAGTVTSAVSRQAAGEITLERFRGVGVAGGNSDTANQLVRKVILEFNHTGLNACYYPQAADMKWSKMLTNLLANATSAIVNITPAEVFSHPGLFRLEMRQLKEALQVMAARGIRVVNLPGTPVSLLAWAVRDLPSRLARSLISRSVGRGRGNKMPSFYLDLHAGRCMNEVAYLNGAVVRFGAELGVPTPVNALLTETLLALARKEVDASRYDHHPEILLENCRSN